METDEIKELTIEYKRQPNESILEYTQRIRQGVVEKFTSTGLPDDPEEMSALASFLNDMDKQEVVKQKLANEEKALESDKAATEIIASMLGKLGNTNPFALSENSGAIIEHDVNLPEVDLVPGELDHNQRTRNFDSFMAEYRAKNPKTEDDD